MPPAFPTDTELVLNTEHVHIADPHKKNRLPPVRVQVLFFDFKADFRRVIVAFLHSRSRDRKAMDVGNWEANGGAQIGRKGGDAARRADSLHKSDGFDSVRDFTLP